MFYQFLKVIMTLAFRVYFRRIEVQGAEHIPKDGAVLLACNHPSSFLEGCLVSCFQDRELHYLVRGDVFEIGWLKPLLRWTNQIPIYRFRDGFSSMKKNKQTFQTTYQVLADGAAVIIYPEGSTKLIKQLRPLQRGLAKLSMGTLEHHQNLPLKIVPVGVNYNDALSFRSSVTISIGPSFQADAYYDDYVQDPHRVLRQITMDVKESLQQHVVHLEDPSKNGVDAVLTAATHCKTNQHQGVIRDDSGFQRQVQMSEHINGGLLRSEDLVEVHTKQITKLDFTVFQKRSNSLTIFTLLLISPLALAGYLLNFPPYWLAKYIPTKRVKHLEFKAAVRIAVWALGQMVFTLVLFLVGLLSGIGNWSFLVLLFPLLGWTTIKWYELYSAMQFRKKNGVKIEKLESIVMSSLAK